MIRIAALILFSYGSSVTAQSLELPSNARRMVEVTSPADSYAMPVGAWVDGEIATLTGEGVVIKQAWRIAVAGLTSLQMIRPLRDQLRNDGFEVVFECTDRACGGFDFRFGTDVIAPPEMQVNLGDFRYLAARKDGVLLSLLASRTRTAGYVQVIRVGTTQANIVKRNNTGLKAATPRVAIDSAGLAQDLATSGRAILHGLTFDTGSAQLGDGPFQALADLADYLADSPDLTIALVGHTDSSGSLEGNIALSKRRAGSVLDRLVRRYDVPRRQLEAQGMGYLSPVAPNLTDAGRDANRRVEVIITSTQ